MTFTIRTLLILIAAIVLLISAFVDVRGFSLLALGLAIFAFAFVVPDTALNTRR